MARRDLTKKTKPQLKKILWKYFSLYVRARDKYICYTCGKPGNQAGHYIPRSQGSATYYNEMNVKCQCYHCNINLSGNSFIFREKLVQEYGEPAVLAMEQLGKTTKKLEKPELVELIEKYKSLSHGTIREDDKKARKAGTNRANREVQDLAARYDELARSLHSNAEQPNKILFRFR